MLHINDHPLTFTLRVKGRAFADMLTPERKKVFNELLTDLKKLKEQERNKLHQRHEEWINTFREQVRML